jgi:hypothetical protein
MIMGLKVRIHFSGLCAFVPNRPINTPLNAATALLVNATQSHHVHHCVFFAEKFSYPDVVLGVPNRPIKLRFAHSEAGEVNACLMTGEELTLVGQTTSGVDVPLKPNYLEFNGLSLTPPAKCPADDTAARYFAWVADMAALQAGEINRTLLTDWRVADDLGLRMWITEGGLECGGFRETSQGIVRWAFGKNSSRLLAEEVIWRHEFTDSAVDKVVLRSKPFTGAPAQRDLVLLPSGNLIVAYIYNMPVEGLLELNPAQPFVPDYHFGEIFRLADGNPAPVVPTPVHNFCPPFTGPSNPKCPPAMFSPLNP